MSGVEEWVLMGNTSLYTRQWIVCSTLGALRSPGRAISACLALGAGVMSKIHVIEALDCAMLDAGKVQIARLGAIWDVRR